MIYHSPLPDVTIPHVGLTDYLLAAAARHGNRTALLDARSGERISYAELRMRVCAGATGLAALGVRPGDVVGLMSGNQPRFAIALYAALAAGATVILIDPILSPPTLVGQLARTRVRVLVTEAAHRDRARMAAAAAGAERVLVLDDPAAPDSIDRLPTGPAPRSRLDRAGVPAILALSSGTSDVPKIVQLSHRNLVANLVQTRAGWRIGTTDVLAAVVPFCHAYGLTMVLNSGLLGGATIVTLPCFEVDEYLRVLAEHHVTRAYLVPPMVLAVAKASQTARYDGLCLRYVLSGGAPLAGPLIVRAERRLGCLIRQGYGMTEAAPGTHQVFDEDVPATLPGSIGRLSPNTEARIVVPGTDSDAEPGAAGELLVRGPQIMSGYLDDPAATAATLADGWLRTGDLARVDADGRFWIVDRLTEVIRYQGRQVAPAELESVLLAHPHVLDAAVVATPHAAGRDGPVAVVVTNQPVEPVELIDFVTARVAPDKKIRGVRFVDAIPRSPTGKIFRRLLKDQV